MDKPNVWLALAGGDKKLAGRLVEIDNRLRAEGITTFYRDVSTAAINGELAELLWRFAERRKGLAE